MAEPMRIALTRDFLGADGQMPTADFGQALAEDAGNQVAWGLLAEDRTELSPAQVAGCEVVLHAASQDLPCLAELGYRPRHLFDTELAGRLLGFPRVGLGVLVETVLGWTLEKGHAAADWSTRPLPTEWPGGCELIAGG